ncbi:response regulator [Sporomusa acidovorans]|uniref:Transcriptional regulatory protein DegU n=1 Tax=Sporomusa acidovorans (strain ATCC 49682 / DSM 3132 / Mol) TaxID=1123286 RepID=A0ABZ3J8P5_SPOA4|nr:response regulator [Sporomusa acidovorans]OZC21224.1 transcriptional regulatory protein DegU [Sporomusa acidovorans DSM 3132]SDE65256.1 Response regulator receiver domain-containing protein [Sporomusa acidovorans]
MYKLLIVDDEPLERQAVRFILDRHCPQITVVGEAGDGVLAVQAAALVQPDIILMDIQMPKMSGLDAARRIRKKLPNVKIMMLTAADNADYRKAATQIGVEEYMLKPVRPDKLVHTVHGILAQVLKKSIAL